VLKSLPKPAKEAIRRSVALQNNVTSKFRHLREIMHDYK
jgi:hypothetical protein